MKARNPFSKLKIVFFLVLTMLSSSASVLPQSGRIGEGETKTSAANEPENAVAPADLSALPPYQYIEPADLQTFLDKLNEFGAKRYRLRDSTQITNYGKSKGKNVNETFLAGVVKLDETVHEYKILEVEETRAVAAALNKAAQAGFRFRQVITYLGLYTGKSVRVDENDGTQIDDLLDLIITMPRARNIILLERAAGKASEPPEYQLIEAEYGVFRQPKEKMQKLIDEKTNGEYVPIALFFSSGYNRTPPRGTQMPNIFGAYYGIIVEKKTVADENEDLQIRFVRAQLQRNLKKDLNALARDGFRIADSRLLEGLMYKNAATANRAVRYQWVKIKSKKLAQELSAMTAAGAKLYGTSLENDFWNNGFIEAQLIFEIAPLDANAEHFEYKAVPLALDAKKSVLSDRTPADAPFVKFQTAIKEGYTFRNLMSNSQSPVAVFERKVAAVNQ